MKDKNYNNDYNNIMSDLGGYSWNGEYKDNGGKFLISKADAELYDEAKAIPAKVVRVKRAGSVTKNERWRIFEDNELKFIIDGEKLSKKERVFLRTIEGVTFLISEFKLGFKSISELRLRLKNRI